MQLFMLCRDAVIHVICKMQFIYIYIYIYIHVYHIYTIAKIEKHLAADFILIHIPLEFVPWDSINDKSALVQVGAKLGAKLAIPR